MGVFHVFVEGPTDSSPQGVQQLAAAIADHYGLPATEILARLQRGRFRVKANADSSTAETYVRDLEQLGARCTIEEATADNSRALTPLPFAAVSPPDAAPASASRASSPALPGAALPPRASSPALPGAALPPRASSPALPGAALPPRAGTEAPPASALPPRPSSPPSAATGATGGSFQSGLAAAFSSTTSDADLGALARGDSAFSLSSVDGVDSDADAAGGAPALDAAGADHGLPATFGPPTAAPAAGKPPRSAAPPVDMFAPPDAEDAPMAVELAADGRELLASKRAPTPPPDEAAPGGERGARGSQPSMQAPAAPASRASSPSLPAQAAGGAAAASRPSRFGPLGEPRTRFAAGVLLSVLLGFIPAHVVAELSEASASAEIDRTVIRAQQAADTPELYAALDATRAAQLARKQGEHRNAAILGFLVWCVAGAAIAFGWFKKIPWDD